MIPEIERLEHNHVWFQQDGATSQTARETMALLKEHFPVRLISRFVDLSWPPRTPDLTPANFFLWGFLKSKVYITKPSNLSELKTMICQGISEISADLLSKVKETVKRAQICISSGGHHLKDIIFKK